MKMAGRECNQPPIHRLLAGLTPSEVTVCEVTVCEITVCEVTVCEDDYTDPLSYEVKI
jgi:hypothetical protein